MNLSPFPNNTNQALQDTFFHNALVDQIFAETLDHFHHLILIQALNCSLNHISDTRFVHGNKALIVHESEETHDELAVHSVSDSTVAGNGFAEILDFKGAFETACEEAAEGSDERSKGCEGENVELHGGYMDGGGDVEREGEGDVGEEGGNVVGVRNKDWVGSAFETSKDVCAKVLIC